MMDPSRPTPSDPGARAVDRGRTLHRLLSTDDVREDERFSYWRDMANQVYVALRPERSMEGEFFGSMTTGSLGDVPLAFVRSCAQRVLRTPAEIARSTEPAYYFNFQLEGESTFSQGGEEIRLFPGDVALIDATRPFELGFTGEFCHFNVNPSEHFIRSRFADLDRLGGLVVRGSHGVGGLASAYMRETATLLRSDASIAEGALLGEHLLGLLTIAFGATEEAAWAAAPSVEEARLRAVHGCIERNLGCPALSPATVAAELKISTRYLHKLFEGRPETFMQRVLRRRLERCRSDLANATMRHRSVSEIAYAWGFSDLSHFGRAFKAAFGEPPREWRRRALDGGA